MGLLTILAVHGASLRYCIESVPEDAEQLQVAIDLPNRAESQVARLEITAPLGRSCLDFESRSRAGQKKRRIC
jgi:hypothetical protein